MCKYFKNKGNFSLSVVLSSLHSFIQGSKKNDAFQKLPIHNILRRKVTYCYGNYALYFLFLCIYITLLSSFSYIFKCIPRKGAVMLPLREDTYGCSIDLKKSVRGSCSRLAYSIYFSVRLQLHNQKVFRTFSSKPGLLILPTNCT